MLLLSAEATCEVSVCCSVLQCVAVCSELSVLLPSAKETCKIGVCCSVLQRDAVCQWLGVLLPSSMETCTVGVCCSVLQRVATCEGLSIMQTCHIWVIHVTYEWVMLHMNESCQIRMSHSYEIMTDSYVTWLVDLRRDSFTCDVTHWQETWCIHMWHESCHIT